MTGSAPDRRARSDGSAPTTGASATRPRTAAAAFGLVVLVGSVVPVPTAPSGGSGNSGGAFGVTVDGAVGVGLGALPAGIGLTAPFHVAGYAVLAALLVRAANRERRGVAVAAALAAAAATAFGFGTELVQAPVPWRSFAWSDAALNAAGAVVGAVIGTVVGAVTARAGAR